MARRVGDNKFSFFRGEIAVRDVNSNALLTLGLQPIYQQRQGRMIDRDQAGSMELKKRQGYF